MQKLFVNCIKQSVLKGMLLLSLYTVTTMILTGQTIYYGHIYHRLKFSGRQLKDPKFIQTEAEGKFTKGGSDVDGKEANNAMSSPIPLPAPL
ncbi:hypothetical protein FNV43_RR17022 [Rhamnella rubrinervis]|uniref:Uncharacterized protein n=1 Tax=Rhamnella rubrinervis TaxID=2594499 RepID=A0A8K0GZU5_9ROSA|nr:hypothetical protein FNV43_RR17022 [Rhamnella rubrinervis]